MWLARIGIVLALLMIIVLKLTSGADPVRRTVNGQSTIFTESPWLTALLCAPMLLAVLVGLVFWMQPSRIFKLGSIVVFGVTSFLLVTAVPSLFLHRAVLTPDRFDLRIGSWYAPEQYSIRFDDVAYADIDDDANHKSEFSRNYVLGCYLKPPNPRRTILLPICDLVRPALRQIVDALNARKVILGDPNHGLRIPPELAGVLD
jgi:hypothetical protein